MLEALLKHIREKGRVCPTPQRWSELWEMLSSRRRVRHGWEPPLPPILAAWWDTSALMKRARLEEHIRHAAAHGVLDVINRYLRALPDEDWAHVLDS
jgi:hypothetical protein